ncbi:MAG: DUF4197 domain-containing protein [Saprospiraceae bacterium]
MRLRNCLSLLLLLALSFSAQAQIGKTLGGLKDKADRVLKGGDVGAEETGSALKEALNMGVGEAVTFLSAEDGYLGSAYRIPVPEEAQAVIDKVKMVPGFTDVEEKLVLKMNRAAELAAAKAKPIFVSAITGMTFTDAVDILMGNKDAATRYLDRTTNSQLFAEFQPVIQQSLDEVNAREYWRSVITAYNKIPFVKKTDPELDRYVTQRALVGMFGLVEKKEAELRDNPALRQTELLRKVFARQDRR